MIDLTPYYDLPYLSYDQWKEEFSRNDNLNVAQLDHFWETQKHDPATRNAYLYGHVHAVNRAVVHGRKQSRALALINEHGKKWLSGNVDLMSDNPDMLRAIATLYYQQYCKLKTTPPSRR